MESKTQLLSSSALPVSRPKRVWRSGSLLVEENDLWKRNPRRWAKSLDTQSVFDALREISILNRPYSVIKSEGEIFQIITTPGHYFHLENKDKEKYRELQGILIELNFEKYKDRFKSEIQGLLNRLDNANFPKDKKGEFYDELKTALHRLETCKISTPDRGLILGAIQKDIVLIREKIDREITNEELRKQGEERFKREQLRISFFRGLLERESIANILGSIMLASMILFLIFVALTDDNDRALTIIENIVLILTGFFFGQQQTKKS
jgi:hypothetical protein